MARFVRILAALALVLAFAVPAMSQEASCRLIRGANTPADPTDDVQVCRQDVWFHEAGTKLGNAAAFGQGNFSSFNTTRPTGSVTSGGGYLGSSATHQNGVPFDPQATATFDGSFTGDIDNFAVTMYMFNPAEGAQQLPTYAINTRLIVDGQSVFEAGGNEVKRSPLLDFGLTRIDFAIVDLYAALKDLGLNGAGREHQVRFQVMGTDLATEAAVFVYDSSLVASGMIFNIEPENLTGYTVISDSDSVNITMSFFRYCQQDPCTPDQFAYMRPRPPGPDASAAENPRGIIDVRPGDRVVWTYNDPLCDFNDGNGGGPSPILCDGHNVIFEDGSVTSPLLRAREFPRDSFSWTVPTTATAGSKIRYYCEPLGFTGHWEIGMTGILRIV